MKQIMFLTLITVSSIFATGFIAFAKEITAETKFFSENVIMSIVCFVLALYFATVAIIDYVREAKR
jgi:hypothetical protein